MGVTNSTPARRVLFVDDDPLILNGLQRSLRHLRSKWQMSFATGGQEALERMDTTRFDVLITDMIMPGMSGADLIEQVHARHPSTIRIILSGQADQKQLLRCIPLAHRFLPKPCEPAELERILDRVGTIEASLQVERVRQVIARLTRIPSVPSIYLQIIQVLQDPEAGVAEVADVVAKDPGTTAGLLRVANSAYFGIARRITDALEAVRFLGVDMVRTLALTLGAFDQLRSRPIPHFSVDDLWSHSMETGSLARAIARHEGLSVREQDLYFVAGLLHDLGRLILADNLTDDWQRIVDYAAAHRCPAHVAEMQVLGSTHAEIAGGLFELWGLPATLVDAVRCHHTPALAPPSAQACAVALHVADHLAGQREGDHGLFVRPQVDHEAVKAAGMGDRVEAWRRLSGS